MMGLSDGLDQHDLPSDRLPVRKDHSHDHQEKHEHSGDCCGHDHGHDEKEESHDHGHEEKHDHGHEEPAGEVDVSDVGYITKAPAAEPVE